MAIGIAGPRRDGAAADGPGGGSRRPGRHEKGRGRGAGVRAVPDARRTSSDDHYGKAFEAFAFSDQRTLSLRRASRNSAAGRRYRSARHTPEPARKSGQEAAWFV